MDIKSKLNVLKLELYISGSSDFSANNKITLNELSAKASGASNMIISQIEANKINFSTLGSSDAKFEGSSDTMVVKASGSGDVIMDKLQSKIAEVEASGSSDIQLFVTEEIKGKASGASSVTYKGSPKIKSASASGSSTIEAQ